MIEIKICLKACGPVTYLWHPYANSVSSEMIAKRKLRALNTSFQRRCTLLLQRRTLFSHCYAKRMTQQVWTVPGKWSLRLHYGKSNCQQVFKHLTGLGNNFPIRHIPRRSSKRHSPRQKSYKTGGGECCLNVWFACWHLCRDQTGLRSPER